MWPRSAYKVRKGLSSLVCAICLLFLIGSAFAHSPHIGQRASWLAPDGKHYNIAVLYGDGIVAADPGRPVVLDSDGLVVALGPLIRDAFVHCRARHDCIVLLDHHSYGPERDDRKVEAVGPDPSGFRPGRTPTFYPEHEKEMYGFKPVELTFADSWVAWTVPFRRAPIIATTFTTMFAVLGFGSGWMLAPAWRVRTEFSSRAAGYVAFLAAWTTASAVVVVFILLLVVLALWLDGSVFNLRPLLVVLFAAFPLGVAYAYVRTVRPSLARQSGNSV